jgi:hypothetical protein
MQHIPKEEVEKLVQKYTSKLEKNIKRDVEQPRKNSEFSREYDTFREEAMSNASGRYERMAKFAGNIIKTKPNEKIVSSLQESIDISHLNISVNDASSFGVFYSLLFGIIALLLGVVAYVFDFVSVALFLGLVFLISLLMIGPLTKIPISLATKWRIRAGNQIVLCILYIVIYMRHTSNLENAIKFASDHIGGPIALDLRKVFWDVEVGRYSNIKESLDRYLRLWRNHNLSFVNSVHLIESSLFEPGEERRLTLLDKSLQVILDGVYSDMLRYAHDLKNPITMLHMLGVILPILGLVIFPLLGAFMGGYIKWYHLLILYNILLPLLVYTIGTNILSKRPSGYSENLIGFEGKRGPVFLAFIVFLLLFLLGISPFIAYVSGVGGDPEFLGMPFFDFDEQGGKVYGPYGSGALLLGLFIPLSFALSIGMYYRMKTKNLLKLRAETKKLEAEFSSSLFQLGTRIGDGIPTESAFKDVAQTMEGTPAGGLFRKIHNNLSKLGMSLRDAIFDRERGALADYPSPLVESSMEVLVESAKKGPQVASQSLISISNYVNSVRNVGERLKDLMSDIISSMKSQISFMAPVIAGIVVGIGSMIVGVISQLGSVLDKAASGGSEVGGGLANLTDLFSKFDTIPPYFFQIIVGIYVVQIIYILTILANGVEFGVDKLNEQSSLGRNLLRSALLYTIVSFIVVLIFNRLSLFVLQNVT